MKNEKPYRINLNGIVCEYLLSTESRKAILLIEGLPAVPQRVEFMNRLREKGYSVFYPRFRGTWESQGNFLKENPAKDVLEVINVINQGIKLSETVGYVSSDFYILATSFGGAISLSLQKNDKIKKIISLSQISYFTKVTGIQTLKSHLRDVFTMAYRFTDEDWENLISNKIIAPLKDFDSTTSTKHLVISGELDEQILIGELKEFCLKNLISIKSYPNVGHISYSRVSQEIFNDIFVFFES